MMTVGIWPTHIDMDIADLLVPSYVRQVCVGRCRFAVFQYGCSTAAGFLHQTVMRHKHVIGFLLHKDFALSLSQLTLVQHFVL